MESKPAYVSNCELACNLRKMMFARLAVFMTEMLGLPILKQYSALCFFVYHFFTEEDLLLTLKTCCSL